MNMMHCSWLVIRWGRNRLGFMLVGPEQLLQRLQSIGHRGYQLILRPQESCYPLLQRGDAH